MKAQTHLLLSYLYIDLTLLFEYIFLYDLISIIRDTELCVQCYFIVTSMYYTTQNLIRIKLLVLFAEGPAYLIPNIL